MSTKQGKSMRLLRGLHRVIRDLVIGSTALLLVAGNGVAEDIEYNWECKWGDCVDGFGSVLTPGNGYEFIGTRKNRRSEGYMITITPNGEVCESLHVNHALVGVRACQNKDSFCVWEYKVDRPSGDWMCMGLAGEPGVGGIFVDGASRNQKADIASLNKQLSNMRSHETAQLRKSFLPETYRADLLLTTSKGR